MNKTWAIFLTVVAMAAVYLLLLVGVPALASIVSSCVDITLGGTANTTALSEATANWTTRSVDTRTNWETYNPPWIIYSIPGLVGICAIVVILKKR